MLTHCSANNDLVRETHTISVPQTKVDFPSSDFAAAFFLLGDSLRDAVNVCIRQLDDFQLAIAISRVYEGDSGPVLRNILEEYSIPYAIQNGYRWLSSWSFWMLGRRDLAIRVIVVRLLFCILNTLLTSPFRLRLQLSPPALPSQSRT